MPLPARVVTRLAILATVISAATAVVDAVANRDQMRLVDALALFFGGAGTGAGVAVLVASRRLDRGARPRTPPVVPWARDEEP